MLNITKLHNLSPAWVVILTIAVATLLGTVLLWLPFANTVSGFTPITDAIFTSVSAVTVTGLVVVDSAEYWSLFGQIVLAVLMFFGGLGLVAGVAFILMLVGRRVNIRGQLIMREDLGGAGVGNTLITVQRVVIFAVVAQIIAAAVLFVDFYVASPLWDGIGAAEAVWQAIFHGISAFNNAGFEILPDARVGGGSFIGISGNYLSIGTLIVVSLFGSLSYPFLRDLFSQKMRFSRLTLDSKLILCGLFAIFVIGFLVAFFSEFNSPALAGRSVTERLVSILFEVLTARTSGFTTVEQSELGNGMGILNLVLTSIGGVTASTAGGVKINTVVVIIIALAVAIRSESDVRIFRRSIARAIVLRALTIVMLFLGALITMSLLMSLFQSSLTLEEIAYEATAALSNSGLGRGLTPDLNIANRWVIIVGILLGRYVPIILAVRYVSGGGKHDIYKLPTESVRIG